MLCIFTYEDMNTHIRYIYIHIGQSKLSTSISASMKVISKNPAILYLGLSQSFFEGAVFTFGNLSYPYCIKAKTHIYRYT
jgi:hypothetical protein